MKKQLKDIAARIQKADGILLSAGVGAACGFLLPTVLERYYPYVVPGVPAPLNKIEVLTGLGLGAGGLIGAMFVKRNNLKALLASLGGSSLAYSLLKLYDFYSVSGARYRGTSTRAAPYVRAPVRAASTQSYPCSSVVKGRIGPGGSSQRPPGNFASSTPYPLQRTQMDNQPNNLQHQVITTQGPKIIYA
jgi:hypothetical protein